MNELRTDNRYVKLVVNLFVLFTFVILSIFVSVYPSLGKFLLIYMIIINLYLMFLHRENQNYLILLIFVSTYWIYMILYYFFDIPYSAYQNFRTVENANGVLTIVGLFVIILFTSLKRINNKIANILVKRKNKYIYTINILIMICITVFALKGNNILSGTYGENTTNSSLFEYYFIFALMAYKYSDKKKMEYIFIIVNFIYSIALLLLGLRLVTMQIGLMIFVLYFDKKFKSSQVVVLSIFAFFLMSGISNIRSGNIHSIDIIKFLGIRDGILRTNQGDVFLTSSVHYGLVKSGIFDIAFRIKSLFAFITNIFLLPQFQNRLGVLNSNLGKYMVGGGGFGSVYAFVWGGYIGVIILAKYIAFFINSTLKTGSIYGFFLIFTFFRWFAYSLPIVFKMGFWLMVINVLMKLVSTITSRVRKNKDENSF